MKSKIKGAVATLALGLSLSVLTAQNDGGLPPGDAGPPPGDGPNAPGAHGGGHHHRPLPPIVMALDTNHDGVIDAAEIANASAALTTLDKNGDGKLTIDELMGPRPHFDEANAPADAPDDRPRPPLPLVIAALDANHDGVIDASEIANASAVLLKLDQNGDGKLTMLELMGPPPHRGHRGQDGADGPGKPRPDGPGREGYPPGPDGGPPPPPPANN
jgi:hypothetical protein